MAEPYKLIQAMIDAYPHRWEKDYVVVHQVAIPASTTVIVSSAKGTKLALQASGKFDLDKVATGDLAAGFKMVAQNHDCMKIISEGKIPAFFNAYTLETGLFANVPIGGALAKRQVSTRRREQTRPV